MTVIKRNNLASLLGDVAKGDIQPVYLFVGERFLCKESADQLQASLLAASPGTVHPIDGDQEDPGRTLSRLLSFSLLPGRQIYRVTDTRLFHSKNIAPSLWDKALQAQETSREQAARRHLNQMLALAAEPLEATDRLAEFTADQWQKLFGFAKPAGDLSWTDRLLSSGSTTAKAAAGDAGANYIATFEKGLPQQNTLILCCEQADKRKRLYTHIKKHFVIIDCAVAAGAAKAAKREQEDVLKELVSKTLGDFAKKIEPRALTMLLERVGFHPVAVVTETEKLALFVGDRPTITPQDLQQMVGRTREDALFELTDSFGKKQLPKTLVTLNRLLDNGIHGLAILATLRNYLRKLLIFRSLQLQPTPGWQRGMNAQQFQGTYLPALKEQGAWPDMLKGHPYALYMSFVKASEFSCTTLKGYLALLLAAELRLKGSPVPAKIVLEELFITMLTPKK